MTITKETFKTRQNRPAYHLTAVEDPIPPLTQGFQPYWRYRLATTNKVPLLPAKSPELEAIIKPPIDGAPPSNRMPINRSVSESTLHPFDDVRHRHQSAGRTGEQNSVGRHNYVHVGRFDENVNYGNQHPGSNVRRMSENFQPDRTSNSRNDAYRISQSLPCNDYGLNRNVSEYPPVRRFSSGGYSEEQEQRSLYHQPQGNVQKGPPTRDVGFNRANVGSRNPGIYRDDSARNSINDLSENTRALFETPLSKKFESMHGIHHRRISNDSGYLTPPHESSNENRSSKSSPPRRIELDDDEQSDLHTAHLRNVSKALFKDSNSPTKIRHSIDNPESVNKVLIERQAHLSPNQPSLNNSSSDPRHSEIMHSIGKGPSTHSSPSRPRLSVHSISEQDSDLNRNETPPEHNISDVNSTGSGSMLSLNSDHGISDSSRGKDVLLNQKLQKPSPEKDSKDETPPPLPPARKKKHQDKVATEDDTKDNNDQERDWSMASGKVRDRVQQFDNMEKKHTKRSHSPFKENRTHPKGIGTDDDVSISVLDPKLKREWFVKAAQSDYHALVALLKKEPKLAAIKGYQKYRLLADNFARDECAAARPPHCHCLFLGIPVAPSSPTPELWNQQTILARVIVCQNKA
ncbi:uncharacterized protein CEXT_658601 [Caerostris extrusa]|uniref:Uncharacterized protein n=1 Tax=Caerostris extrusa TaxID=172846 RepID=A0AAV4SJ10_CAEEX|nr:uncharacterized protein CEXT_658601 [Caerostris extrusa]